MSEQNVQTARSYRAGVIDDNAIISLNLKWLLQLTVLVCSLVYGYWRIETRIKNLENGILSAKSPLRSII